MIQKVKVRKQGLRYAGTKIRREQFLGVVFLFFGGSFRLGLHFEIKILTRGREKYIRLRWVCVLIYSISFDAQTKFSTHSNSQGYL